MRIALLTEGGYPYARGESVVWCDRLLRGLEGHAFEVYALSRSVRQEDAGWCELPSNVELVRTAPLWGTAAELRAVPAGPYGRRERRRFRTHFAELAEAFCTTGTDEGRAAQADRFSAGLLGLAELARECGGLPAALRSETAVRLLESACRAPGALRAAHAAQVADLLEVADRLERALRPLSLDWYGAEPGGERGLAAADLCHAVGGGPAALPGLLAQHWYGTPLLITEYGVRLREHYLASAADAVAPAAAGAPVRALLASFQGLLTRESYTRAQLITPGNSQARRWQERCGARRERLRTVYPGMDAAPFEVIGEQAAGTAAPPAPPAPAGEATEAAGEATGPALVWVGRMEPAKDLIGLLHAFAQIRRTQPAARLRIVAAAPGRGPEDEAYAAHCRALAERLCPREAEGADGARGAGAGPVIFEELGSPRVPTLADAYAAAGVVVLSSVVEGFPVSLVQAMFSGRATVSTDTGAVCEVIGGTGIVVPPSDPAALAEACTTLLRDPARRARLGAAARARALELFTVEQNIRAFRDIYLELLAHTPSGDGNAVVPGERAPRAFARPAESHVPGRWAGSVRTAAAMTAAGRRAGRPGPSWSRPEPGAGAGAREDVRGDVRAGAGTGLGSGSGAGGA